MRILHRTRRVATMVRFVKINHRPMEYKMSDCRYGCKEYRCPCGKKGEIHNSTYGCRTSNENSPMIGCFGI